MKTQENLSAIARVHKVKLETVIDPVMLAVRVAESGVAVKDAAILCGVGRTALHAKIKLLKELKNDPE